MATRSSAHAQEERGIFEAFLATHPAFAARMKQFRQPDEEFPDIVTVLTDGSEIDFELGEWLDGAQMAAAKRYDGLARELLDAIGPQGPNPSTCFRTVMLCPLADPPRWSAGDGPRIQAAVRALIEETERQWPGQRFWQSPQGRICRDLGPYSPLGRYLRSVNFAPLVVRGEEHPRPASQRWIFVEARGGFYSPETASRALERILEQKVGRYGHFSRPTRLIIYYGKAAAYNTPYLGVETREFSDIAALAAKAAAGQQAFETIYLLNALQPGLETYEVYPACRRCA